MCLHMAQKLYQFQKLLQRMALTPKMKHSIQMLGMSVTDLNDYIDSVLASNPFLERKVPKNRTSSYEYNDAIKGEDKTDPREMLLSHINTLHLDKSQLEIAEYLIREMDDNGYIKVDSEEVARELFTDAETVESIFDVIQCMDPPGIGARDIRECLQLQLKRSGKENSLEYTIVTDFLSDVAVNDIPRIATLLNIDKERVREAFDVIKKLNPRPGSTLLSKGADPVIPDLVANVKDEKVRIELNRESIPHLRLFNPYADKLDVIKDPNARKFLKANMEAARNLIDNIKRREETMCKVADFILKKQKENIASGNDDLKTLTLLEIAEALEMHPSTISRTVSNKYVHLNDRVIQLKELLSQGHVKENGDVTSKVNIKNTIKRLIDTEDKTRPTSDSEIQQELEKEGIKIKRRTVAKYRNSQKILPVHLRRKKSVQTIVV